MSEAFTVTDRPAPTSASTTRGGAAATLVVVHVDATPAAEAIAAYTARGSRRSPHYHVAADGAVTRLVPEARAARHSGSARLGGRRRNIDRSSVAVVVEQAGARPGRGQATVLRALVADIQARLGILAENGVLRWLPPAGGAADGTLELYQLPEGARGGAVLGLERRTGATLGIADSPDAQQQLWSFLANEAAKVRGGGFNIGSAFHLHAAKNGMGAPLGPSSPRASWISVGGKSYNYQHFARDTAFNEGENWGAVQTLSDRLQGSFPAPGSVEYQLLQSAYAAGIAGSKPTTGNTGFNPTWATTQAAAMGRLGPTLGGAYRITAGGASYAIQVFGADVLYTPIANPESATVWSDVRKLSETPAGPLADALWAEAYKTCGAAYSAASPFQQAAAAAKLGAPLTGVYQATFAGAQVSVQVFALDTLYQEAGGAVQRQSQLAQPPAVSGWAPKPSTPPPAPPPQAQPAAVPAASIVVPGGDRSSPAWPPKPANLPPLYSTEARQQLFGKFDYVAAPVAGNAERIQVLGTWKQDNIVPVVVPQLAALAGKGVRGAPRSGTMFWHKLAVKQLLGLWKAWEDAGLLDRVINYMGDYNARFIRGSTTQLSNHAFGTAFDISTEPPPSNLNWLGVQPALVGQRGCVRELVPIANAYGFYWGGHFDRLDGMHFEVAKLL